VQYRSVRKCAKTGQPAACPGSRHSPDDRYCLKIKGVLQGPENDLFFLKIGEIPSQMPPVRHRRASGIQDPPVDITGVRYLLVLLRSGGRQCHRQRLTTGPVLTGPGSAQPPHARPRPTRSRYRNNRGHPPQNPARQFSGLFSRPEPVRAGKFLAGFRL